MIPTKTRDNRRSRVTKLSRNLARLYKEVKCRDCSVVVPRMDFAKILGKFTKVKIQYERSTTPKTKRNTVSSPSTRLNNENGMVQIHRSAYNPHPAKKLLGVSKRSKTEVQSPLPITPTPNILKENNRLRKTVVENSNIKSKHQINTNLKKYGIVFISPSIDKKDIKNEISLDNLLPDINKNLLPSEEWCIEYFPINGEPKDDKIYDRIAAELEDLMYNEQTKKECDAKDSKMDDFPSILDILNDNSKDVTEKTNSQTITLESSDVEAMLLGKTKATDSTTMVIENADVSSLLTGVSNIQERNTDEKTINTIEDNPESPSILNDASEGAKEEKALSPDKNVSDLSPSVASRQTDENENTNTNNRNKNARTGVTQVVFKKTMNGSSKTVTCPNNLQYSISIQGKSIELIGAPKYISSLEDLQVLLQIVDESELTSIYVLI